VPRSRAAECGGAGVGRRARGVDIVHQAHGARNRADCEDAATNVPPALLQTEATLTRKRVRATKQLDRRHSPELAESHCKATWCHAAARPGALRIARDMREHVDLRWR